MSRLLRPAVAGLVILLMSGSAVCAEGQAWQLSMTVPSGQFVLGEPVWTLVSLTNVSGKEVSQAAFLGEFYLDGAEKPCRPLSGPTGGGALPGGQGHSVQPISSPGTVLTEWVDLGYLCNLARRESPAPGPHTVCYRYDESPGLLNPSACVSFSILPPEGVDKQAYEAFGHEPLRDSLRWGELLRRFPTSTYAGYLVWKLYVRGIVYGWSNKALISFLGESAWSDSNSVPCDIPERCGDTGWMSLQGEEFRQWRVRWFDTILKHHPAIWFADEVRLKLALDRYLLGDKEGCAAGLEDLAEHGKPYVASKAAELLASMKAKGMLGEGAK